MATSSSIVDVTSFTTDAKFRSWGSAVSAAIVASGLTVTGDTGQINWTTVTKPVATNTKAGYEVYRFNDTLQSTKPIFFRIDYGSSNVASGNSPGTWLTVGTGSDGAGNITGVGMVVTQGFSGAGAVNNATCTVGAAYSTTAGACTIIAGLAVSTNNPHYAGGLWCVARTCDSSGNPTGDGVVTYNHTDKANPAIRCASFSPAVAQASRNVGSGSISPAASISTGSVVQLYKNYALIPAPYGTLGAVSYYTADITALSTFSAAPFTGTSHTYLALGINDGSGHDASISANMVGAYIWE